RRSKARRLRAKGSWPVRAMGRAGGRRAMTSRPRDNGTTMSNPRENAVFEETSFLYGGNASFVEDLYARYKPDPGSVDPSWRSYFASLNGAAPATGPSWLDKSWPPKPNGALFLDALGGQFAEAFPDGGQALRAKVAERMQAQTPAATQDEIRRATLD